MEPVTTSKVPAIIRKCGNFKVAKRDIPEWQQDERVHHSGECPPWG